MSGVFEVDLSGDRPRVVGTLELDVIDAGPLRSALQQEGIINRPGEADPQAEGQSASLPGEGAKAGDTGAAAGSASRPTTPESSAPESAPEPGPEPAPEPAPPQPAGAKRSRVAVDLDPHDRLDAIPVHEHGMTGECLCADAIDQGDPTRDHPWQVRRSHARGRGGCAHQTHPTQIGRAHV